MSNRFYVYLLLDPRNYYIPFYVGKGQGDRAASHLTWYSNTQHNPHKSAKIQKIRDQGLEPAVLLWQTDLSETMAFDLEIKLISKFGRKGVDPFGVLTNITAGGQGLSGHRFSDEHKENLRKSLTGRKRSEETRQRIREAAKNRKPISDEVRKKMSETRKGKGTGANNPMYGRTGEQHPNYGKAGNVGDKNGMFGRNHSEETKKKISERALARNQIR